MTRNLLLTSALALAGCDAAEPTVRDAAPASTKAEKPIAPPIAGPAVADVALEAVVPASPELERAAAAWVPTIRACYAAALREAEVVGSVEVSVTGDARKTSVATPGLPDTVRDRVSAAADAWDFAAFGATGDVELRFVARVRTG